AGEPAIRVRARELLEQEDPELWSRFFGAGAPLPKRAGRLCPVLVTGSRQPLEKALAAGLAVAIRAIGSKGRPPQFVTRLEAIAAQDTPSGTGVVALYEEANEYLAKLGSDGAGLLLFV